MDTIRRHPFQSVLAPLLLVEALSGVLQVYFTPLYPKLADHFRVSIGTMSWSLTAWTLATVVTTPLLSKLGDLHGHRTILRVQTALVATGSILVAAAPNFPVLLVGRVLQGTLAAYLPLMFGLVRTSLPENSTRRAIAYLSSIVLFGALVGTIGVGAITEYLHGPTWALWLPAIGTLAGLAALWTLPPAPTDARPPRTPIDWPGAGLLAGGLASLLLGIGKGPKWGWHATSTTAFITAGVVLLVAWVETERRTNHPLVDLRQFANPAARRIYLVGGLIYFGFLGGQVATAGFLAAKLGLTAFGIALALVPVFGMSFLGAAATARLGQTIGYAWTMALGAAICTVGYTTLVLDHGSTAPFVIAYSVAGLGNGMIEASTRTLIVDAVPRRETSIGTGVFELAITTGAAVGSAVATALLTSHVAADGTPTEHGYTLVWWCATGLCLASTAAAVAVARSRRLAPTDPTSLDTSAPDDDLSGVTQP